MMISNPMFDDDGNDDDDDDLGISLTNCLEQVSKVAA